ncbi:hypothetical protein Pfo_005408, partial [Paulownia fortunei]
FVSDNKIEMDNPLSEMLTPSPSSPMVPPSLIPQKVTAIKHPQMAKLEFVSKGQSIALLTNHFKVAAFWKNDYYHYYVLIKHEDSSPISAKDNGRSIIENVQEPAGQRFVYDGHKSLLTISS